MFDLKMSGHFYDDVKLVCDAVSYLQGMIEFLEKEAIEKDKGKTAPDSFIYLNGMKTKAEQMVEDSKRLFRAADIEQFGELSEYVRPYLGYKKQN